MLEGMLSLTSLYTMVAKLGCTYTPTTSKSASITPNLLGSKTLGTKCIRISICNVLANHDQNLESRFRLLKVCLVVKLESSVCRIYWTKSTRLNRSKIGLDRSNLAQIFFFFCVQNFQLSPSPYDV